MSRAIEREEARLETPDMTGAGAAIDARGCLPIFSKNQFPRRPRHDADSAPQPVSQAPFSMVRTIALEVLMNISRSIGTAPDHAMARLVSDLELEFERAAGEPLAYPVRHAEEVNSRWDAKVEERWIAAEEGVDDKVYERGQITIYGRRDGEWFFGTRLVGGDDQAQGTIGADGSGHWFGLAMRCSMRTDREHMHVARRRRLGAVSSLLFRRKGREQGTEGKQDKCRVSRPCLSDCLHILFLGDRGDAARDSRDENGGNLPFLARNRETRWRRGA